jgi:hypothetical protein
MTAKIKQTFGFCGFFILQLFSFIKYFGAIPVENPDFGAIRFYLLFKYPKYSFFGAIPAIRFYLFLFVPEDIHFYRG